MPNILNVQPTYSPTKYKAQSTEHDKGLDMIKQGQCITCGIQTHQPSGMLNKSLVPLTKRGLVLNGRCLLCKPLQVPGEPSTESNAKQAGNEEDEETGNAPSSKVQMPVNNPGFNNPPWWWEEITDIWGKYKRCILLSIAIPFVVIIVGMTTTFVLMHKAGKNSVAQNREDFENNVAQMNKDYENKAAQMQEDYDNHVAQMNEDHESKVAQMHEDFNDSAAQMTDSGSDDNRPSVETTQMKEDYDNQVAQMNEDYESKVAQMHEDFNDNVAQMTDNGSDDNRPLLTPASESTVMPTNISAETMQEYDTICINQQDSAVLVLKTSGCKEGVRCSGSEVGAYLTCGNGMAFNAAISWNIVCNREERVSSDTCSPIFN